MSEEDSKREKSEFENACEDLFNYAVDREDVMWLVKRYSQSSKAAESVVEYELQILKIVGVGWSLAYFLEGSPCKDSFNECYWNAVRAFSGKISENAGKIAEKEIDYFGILKERLDMYLKSFSENSTLDDATKIIAPAFAKQCGEKDDIFLFMAGAKMFDSVSDRVRRYLKRIRALA